MLNVADVVTQFREQFKQEVGKLQKDNKEIRTSALLIYCNNANISSECTEFGQDDQTSPNTAHQRDKCQPEC